MFINLDDAISLGLITKSNNKAGYKVSKRRFKIAQMNNIELPKDYNSLDELLYCLVHNTTPDEHLCKICGKPCKFKEFSMGYTTTCSENCRRELVSNSSFSNKEVISRILSTRRYKYNNDPEYKAKVDKCLNIARTDRDIIAKKAAKMAATRSYLSNKFCIDNNCTLSWDLVARYGQGWYKAGVGQDQWINTDKRGYTYIPNELIPKIEDYYYTTEGCHRSHGEDEVLSYVQSIYSGLVKRNYRELIPPKEVDIYVPDKNLAIEYNGEYWHKGDTRIPDKIDSCSKLGVRLISIYDFMWKDKKEICKSIIASALGVYDHKLSARDCEFRSISSQEMNIFCDENHINGRCNNAKFNYGLFYDNELVQAISLGKDRFNKGSDEIELYRMVTKCHYSVRGGFSKLLKNFSRSTSITSIISFIDRTYFDGHGYNLIGAEHLYYTDSRYFYKKGDRILNRVAAMKYKLPELLGDGFNPDLTEKENMLNNGWHILYDGGNEKVRINI